MPEYNSKQVHDMIQLVMGDDGRIADEIVECLEQEYNNDIESQIDGFIQSETDRQRGK
tara:strand:- start:33 stop:206 length:174 start_codon:yes stop_codon:yes gene_type:complete